MSQTEGTQRIHHGGALHDCLNTNYIQTVHIRIESKIINYDLDPNVKGPTNTVYMIVAKKSMKVSLSNYAYILVFGMCPNPDLIIN